MGDAQFATVAVQGHRSWGHVQRTAVDIRADCGGARYRSRRQGRGVDTVAAIGHGTQCSQGTKKGHILASYRDIVVVFQRQRHHRGVAVIGFDIDRHCHQRRVGNVYFLCIHRDKHACLTGSITLGVIGDGVQNITVTTGSVHLILRQRYLQPIFAGLF